MKQEKNTEIPARLAEIIENAGLTANSFAAKLDYPRSQTVYDILNGKSAPSCDFFRRFLLSEFSETYNIDWLITGRGEMLLPTIHQALDNHDALLAQLIKGGNGKELIYSPDAESSYLMKLLGLIGKLQDTLKEVGESSKELARINGELSFRASMADKYYNTIVKQAEQIGQLKERLTQAEMRITKDAQSVNTAHTANAG